MKRLLVYLLSTSILFASSYTVTPGSTVNVTCSGSGSGSGTCTSVGLAEGSTTDIYDITGSPVTTSGTLTFSLKTQPANACFAGPTTGANAEPTFRALVANDIPALSALNGQVTLTSQVSGVLPIANGGTNNSAALLNNRVIYSAGGSLGEGGSLSALKAVVTNSANRLETSAATAAQVAALQGLSLTGSKLVASLGGTLTEWNSMVASKALATDSAGMPISSPTSAAQLAALSSLAVNSVAKTDASGNLTTGQVNLASQVTGNLPVTNLGGGTNASASTFWRGDGSWQTAGVTFPLYADDSYSVSTPSYSRSGDTNTGIGFPAADQVSMIAAGKQILEATYVGGAYRQLIFGSTSGGDIPIFYMQGTNMASGSNQGYFSITDGTREWAIGYGLGGVNNTRALQIAPGSGAAIASHWTFDTGGFVADKSLSTAGSTVALTADNQSVTTNTTSFILLTSDNVTATNRTFVLSDGNNSGQRLTLMWNDATNAGELADTGNCKLSAIWTLSGNQYYTLNLIWDGTNWVEIGRSNN